MFIKKQSVNPIIVGIINDNSVTFILFVSFLIASSVVAQGKWNKQNIIVHIAVIILHPFVTNKFFSVDKLSISIKVLVFI